MAYSRTSANEKDRQLEKFRLLFGGDEGVLLKDVLVCGCNGGSRGLEVEVESSLVLEILSELLIATARANVLLLELIGLMSLLFLFLSHAWLIANRFLLLLVYAFSGFAMSLIDEVEEASAKLVKDFDLPL